MGYFKPTAHPENPIVGQDFSKEELIVVPEQAMSLEEMLERFVRMEELPVGHNVEHGDEDLDNPLNEDLEKIAVADLTEKAEFVERLKEVTTQYEKQEKSAAYKAAKLAEEKRKAAEEERIESEVRKRTKENSNKSA